MRESGNGEKEVLGLQVGRAALGETRARRLCSQAISRAANFSQDFGVSRLLHCSTTRNQIDYQNDQREQQQQVNESTHRVT